MTAPPSHLIHEVADTFSERAKALKERLNGVFWRGLSEEGLLREAAE